MSQPNLEAMLDRRNLAIRPKRTLPSISWPTAEPVSEEAGFAGLSMSPSFVSAARKMEGSGESRR
jgi:hypothetical protein